MTSAQLKKNMRARDNAIAQQRLEGLAVPPEAVRDLDRIVRGEISTTDALHNAYARYAHIKVIQL